MSDFRSITHTEPTQTPSLGEMGERLALEHLTANGYRVVLTNFRVPVGRNSRGVAVTGEIDIIAMEGETLCFVEVKTRRSEDFTPIITAVDRQKQMQIARTARVYRRLFNITDTPIRFDVVTVLMPKHADHRIDLMKGLWSESSYQRNGTAADADDDLF